jgi:hypothetical protein
LTDVGVVTKPTVADALQRLDALGYEEHTPDLLKRDAIRLYKFLDERFEEHTTEIKEAFERLQIVYTPKPDDVAWSRLPDCCWSAPKDVERYLSVRRAEGQLRQLKEFFCEKLQMRTEPTADQWVEALEQMVNDEGLATEDAPRLALAVYKQLNSACADDPDAENATWASRLRQGTPIRVHRQEWWRNDDDVFLADDDELAELFGDVDGVGLVDVAPEHLPSVARVFQLLHVPRLSEAVDPAPPDNVEGRDEPEVSARVGDRLSALARYLWHKHSDLYKRSLESGRLLSLGTLAARSYSPLTMTVKLRGHQASKQYATWCECRHSGAQLFVDRNAVGDWDLVGIELCRVLGLPDTEGLTISRILATPSDGECAVLLKKLKVGALPEEERARVAGVHSASSVPDHIEDASDDSLEPGSSQGPSGRIIIPAGSDIERIASPSGSAQGNAIVPVSEHATTSQAGVNAGELEDGASEPVGGADSLVNDTAVDQDGYEDPLADAGDWSPDQEASDEDVVAGDANSSAGSIGRRPSRWRSRTPAQPSRVAEERLRSYVSAPNTTTDPHDEFAGPDAEERRSIEAAAVRRVLAWEQAAGRVPTDENDEQRNNPGYDVASRNAAGEVERYIEVKGVRGPWTDRGVMLTPKQFQFATTHGDSCWLYVVEHALANVPPAPHRIRNFARRVWRFGFDDGWRKVEEVSGVSLPSPELGMRMRLAGGRIGVVISVSGVGALKGVDLRMEDDGAVVRELWRSERLHPLGPGSH